ncbi:MAG: hypothetical protein ACPIOQ_65475, partial [Promethearchaeia archaeon]
MTKCLLRQTLRPREASSGRMQTPILLLLLLLGSAQGFLPVPMTGCRVLPARAPPVGAVLAPLPICNRLRASGGARRTAARSQPTVMAAGKLGSLMSEPDPPPESVLSAVEKAGGRVTVADVASGAGISLPEAKAQLTVLAQLAQGDLEVSADGELVYRFGSSFRSELSARSSKKRLQEAWDKVAPVAFYLVRVSFGVALLSSIALIFTVHRR